MKIYLHRCDLLHLEHQMPEGKLIFQIQIYMTQHGDSVKGYILRIFEMKKYLAFMPCLKDTEGAATELVRADKSFTGMELCYIILNTIPYVLTSA